MSRGRALVGGGAIVVLYLLAVTFTGSGSVRPLLDGFAPAPEYHWVDPPPYFAPGNRAPSGVRAFVGVTDGVSTARGVATPDGQVVMNLARGAVTVPQDDRRIRVVIEPRAGAGRLPDGLRANGNTVRITMTALPSETRITTLDRPGTLVLQVPELNTDLLRRTGAGWEAVPSNPVPPRGLSITTALDRTGDYLSGTNLPLFDGPEGTADHSVAIAIGVGGATLAILGGVAWFVRRRHLARAVVSPSAGTPDPDPGAPDPPSAS